MSRMCGKGWGGKGYSAFSGDSAVLGGLCGERGCCPFAMVVEMERVDATGGASKASDRCSFAKVAGMERFGATGGASKARMPEMNAQRL